LARSPLYATRRQDHASYHPRSPSCDQIRHSKREWHQCHRRRFGYVVAAGYGKKRSLGDHLEFSSSPGQEIHDRIPTVRKGGRAPEGETVPGPGQQVHVLRVEIIARRKLPGDGVWVSDFNIDIIEPGHRVRWWRIGPGERDRIRWEIKAAEGIGGECVTGCFGHRFLSLASVRRW